MRVWQWLLAGWCIVSLLVALCGYFALRIAWQAEVEREIIRDATAAKTIFEAGSWSLPVEGDEEWISTQDRLAVSAFPVPVSQSRQGNTVQWQRVAGQGQRILIDLPINPQYYASAADENLRVQRNAGWPNYGIWWWGWLVMNGCAAIAFAVAFFSLSRFPKTMETAFEPWANALRRGGASRDALLPPESADGQELGFLMESTAASVNRAYAELRLSCDRSNLVLSNLRDGVLAVDSELRILVANRSFLRLLDIEELDYLYRPFLEIVRTPAITKLVMQVLETQAPAQNEFQSRSGRDLRVHARKLRLFDDAKGVLITLRDESLIKRVDMIKRDFVSNASHELKTPLAAIRAYAETLQNGVDDKEQARYFVGSIVSQADRLDGLVQGMLQLSRVEDGASLKIMDFDVADAIEPCVKASQAVADAKGIDFSVEAPAKPITIRSDRDGFQTIASNLLSNAVRYTERGGRVRLKLDIMEDQLVFEVSDTGIGMTEQDLERIFERFYRAQKDRSTASGGTGLGLSIVKHLTQSLGGSVTATSQIDEGSSFVVTLPLTPED